MGDRDGRYVSPVRPASSCDPDSADDRADILGVDTVATQPK